MTTFVMFYYVYMVYLYSVIKTERDEKRISDI